jgi:hypothetical protein
MPSMRTLTIMLPLTLAFSCGGNTRVSSDGGMSSSSGGSSGNSSSGSGSSSGSSSGSGSGATGSSSGGGASSGTGSSSGTGGGSGGSSSGVCASLSDAGSIDGSAWGEGPDGSPWSLICPETQPVSGTSCIPAAVGAYCEYGSAWWSVARNTVMYCETNDGVWINRNPSVATCFPEPGPNCGSCPTNPSSLSGNCSPPGLDCYYGEGTMCTCTSTRDVWECFPPGGCPSTRPRIGSPCSSSPSGGCPYTCADGVGCKSPGPTWQPINGSNCGG